jgi:CDP-paratose 2-epimerase
MVCDEALRGGYEKNNFYDDAVRKYSPDSVILYSSTNKVYGDFEYLHFREESTRYVCEEYPNGFPESISLDFHSPYGCSKGCADQ